MDDNRSAVFTIAVIAAIILIFTAADLIQDDRVFSETENKVLASRPKFTVKTLLEGKYTKDYEKYVTDQFVSRDKWIAIKTYTELALLKQEINGVYLGRNGYLVEQHLPEDYSEETAEEKLKLLRKLTERWDARVMLVPTADNILRDILPAHAPFYDEKPLLAKVADMVGEDNYIDVFSVLEEHGKEEIYYRTDHHWTSLGAYYGYLAWKKAWIQDREQERAEREARFLEESEGEGGKRYGIQTEGTGKRAVLSRCRAGWTDVWTYEEKFYGQDKLAVVSEDFLGTLHSKVNIDVAPDVIRYFPETRERPVKVTYDLRTVRDTCYEESYLETKNQYGFFLDDNHAIVEIETDYHNGKTLFVIKDSYANCFIPMLLPYYERIYVMDLRYFNGRLFRYMESCEPEEGMDVLLLYNCIHFLEDFVYVE